MIKFQRFFRLTLESFADLDPAIQKAYSQLKIIHPSKAKEFVKVHNLKVNSDDTIELNKLKTVTKAILYEELLDILAYLTKNIAKRKLAGIIQ